MQHATPATVLGNFSGNEFEYFGETTTFLTRDEQFVVRTLNENGALTDYPVKWVFGVEPLQQYLVEFPGGRLQALPFAWDSRPAESGGQRWFHLYPDEHIAPGDILHWTGRQQNWNFMCAECHSTNVVMGYDVKTDSFNTSYSELSVGCEACHGPGSRHVAQAQRGEFVNSRFGLALSLDDQGRAVWAMNPATGIAERSEPAMQAPQQPESCGRCHARRSVIAEEYEYGRPLADTHMLSMLEEGLYFADGQVQDEVYVYGSFVQSKMYRAGVSCSNCHNPHSLELVTSGEPGNVCAQCHLPSTFAVESHTGHPEATVACVDCHMPSRTYMGVDDRRDHSFRVPRPDLNGTTGVPNACVNCHTDESNDWAASAVQAWHGPPSGAEFASALQAGRRGAGNAALLSEISDPATPGIARATALGLLAPPFGEDEVNALRAGLNDADPLMRIAAVRLLRSAPAEFRLQSGTGRLADAVRAVRIEAALAYADVHEMLPPVARQDFARAQAEYRASHEMLLDRPDAWVSLADLDIAMGRVAAALAKYERAVQMQPLLVRARVNLADALRQSGDDHRGRQVLEEGIELVPGSAALHHSLGLLLVREGDLAAATLELHKAVELEPHNQRYVYVLDIARSELTESVPE